MTTWLSGAMDLKFRTIDGLSIRFAESRQREDHALLPVLLPIPGTSAVAHLEENMAAALIEFSPEQVQQLETGCG